MTTDSAVRNAVSSLAYLGANAIKVWYLQLPDSSQPHARDMLMIAGEQAKRSGLPLIVHATQLPRAKEAVAAGARVLVHNVETGEVDDEFIEAARRTGTIVIPTLTVREGYGDVGFGRLRLLPTRSSASIRSLVPSSSAHSLNLCAHVSPP